MKDGWNVIIRYDEAFLGMSMWIVKQNPDGSRVTVQPINLTEVYELTPGALAPEATLKFDDIAGRQFLQGLAEALVEAGFRPDELKAHDKELEATKNHLEDMRTLVFQALLPGEVTPPMPK